MDNQKEVSLTFKNTINNEKKLQEYEDRLQRIYSYVVAFDKGQSKSFSQIENATKNMNKEIKLSEESVEKLGKKMEFAFNTASIIGMFKSTQKLFQTFAKFASKSSSYIENVNLLEVAYSNANETIEESSARIENFIDKMSEVYGLDESRLTRQFGIFKQLANAMELPTETAENLSEIMVKMTNDISSLYNLDLDRASNALQSALAGQVRPIRSATGADITEKTLQNTVDDLGLDRSISQLSYVEKRLIMVISLTNQLKNSQGDYARTIESASNQIRVMKEQWERLSRAVGNVFFPILQKILPYINGIMMALTEVFNLIASLLGFEMPEFDYSGLAGTSDAVNDLIEGMDGASASAENLKQKLSGLRGFDKLNVITTPKDTSTASLGGGIDPKILDSFANAFSEYDDMLSSIRMKALDIRDAILDWLGFTDGSYKNLKLIGAILATIVGYKLIKGIAGIITGSSKLGKILGTGGLYSVLKKLIDPIKVLGAKDGLQYIFLSAKDAIVKFLSVAIKVTSVIAGVILSVKGLIDVFNSFKPELNEVNEDVGKLALGFGELVAGGAGIGTVIAPGIGTLIGGLAGALAGATAAIISYNIAYEKMLKSQIYGTLTLSVEQWTDMLNKSGIAIDSLKAKHDNLISTLDGLKSSFNKSLEELEIYGVQFGILGQQITEEDMEKINSSLEKGAENAKSIIDENTQYGLNILTSTFSKGTSFTEEEQQKITSSLVKNGNDQKETINTAQENITDIYENAIKTRGYLTAEESKTIQEALDTIRKQTQKSYEENNYDLEFYKTKFNDKSMELDEQSYENWKTARDKFEKEQTETIENNYKTQYQWAVNHRDELEEIEGGYQQYLNDIYGQRILETEKMNTTLDTYQSELTESLKKKYQALSVSNDNLTEDQKINMEKQKGYIKDMLIKLGEWEKDTEDTAKIASNSLKKAFEEPIKIPVLLDDKKLRQQWNTLSNELNQASREINTNSSVNYSIAKFPNINPTNASYAFANGGLPPVGQLFIANEKGPELVGQIGGQSFVANQNQMMDLLDRKIGNASQPMNATFVIQVGDKEIARQVITDLQDMAKSNGKPITIGG